MCMMKWTETVHVTALIKNVTFRTSCNCLCSARQQHCNPVCNFWLSSRFLYSDEVQIGPETVMTTLYTAKKYAVPALEAHCVEFLKKNLRADNAFMLLTQVSAPHPLSVT